jgi:hypothetical protein
MQGEIDSCPWNHDKSERIGMSLLKRKWQRGFGYIENQSDEEEED